jgi:GNAT superfamily N-acetyltransferase
LAKLNGELVGTICICEQSESVTQLRWFSVDPEARGNGLGKTLIGNALSFSSEQGYSKVILWTVAGLAVSKSLYVRNGFELTYEVERELWGKTQLEQRYEKHL